MNGLQLHLILLKQQAEKIGLWVLVVSFIGQGDCKVHRENHQLAESHRQTLSHISVSSTIKTNNKRWHYLTLHYGSDELKKKAIQCVCSNKMYQTLVYVPVVCLIK
jgi:hypothetical protein